MCKKWCVLSLVLLGLGFGELVQGSTIAHWKFDGPLGEPFDEDVDVVGGYVAMKFYDATYGTNAAEDVFYGSPNPWYGNDGTGADLKNDPGGNDPGVGLFVPDPGVNTPLDLSTVGAFTIEAFVYPHSLRLTQVIVRKYGGGQYYIDATGGGNVRFSINRDTNHAAAGDGAIKINEWHHIAAVFDEADAAPMRIYVNGELKGIHDGRERPTDSTRSLGIGSIIRDSLDPPGNSGQFFNGQIDEVRISAAALAVEDFLLYTVQGAARPNPADGATDVPRDAGLSWVSAQTAASHDVYLGTVLEDVENASVTNPLNVLVSRGQSSSGYEPVDVPEFGQTYYWRVDTTLADGNGDVKGAVWSFTVEPYSYPVENILATASSVHDVDTGPEKTVDSSGLDERDLHSVDPRGMWLSAAGSLQPTWIRYEFDRVHKLHEMWVWNQNQELEPSIGFGAKSVTIEYSTDGEIWAMLGEFEFARGGGSNGYAANTRVDFAGVAARYVRLTIASNWGGIVPQYGLSEVRFFSIPVFAREPSPFSGEVNLAVDLALSWRTGRDASGHDVYLSTDKQAVIDGTALAATVTEPRYVPSADLDKTYYWRIDEVNSAETPAVWAGDIWTFSTRDHIIVDDFERYDAAEGMGTRIYEVWADGYDDPRNGSLVGYAEVVKGTFGETGIVQRGKQSMPLFYDNSGGAVQSEATRTFEPGQDWTKHAISTLTLYFHGAVGNTGRLYASINGTKFFYDGPANALALPIWTPWNVDLTSSFGGGPGDVRRLAVGLEGAGASGVVYVDEIRLYAAAPPTPETLWLEAESGAVTAPWMVVGDPDASGGAHVTVPLFTHSAENPPASGRITLAFAVAGGTYRVQAYVIAPDVGDDSMWLRIPGGTTNTKNHASGWVQAEVERGANWHWSDIRSIDDARAVVDFTLTAGQHNLEVAYRMDGLLIDAFVISKVD